MTQLDFDKPVDPKSRAWCSEDGCGLKWWGIWSHAAAHRHHELAEHLVHVMIPDTEEEKAARAAELERLDKEFEDAIHLKALVLTQEDSLNGRPYRTLDQIKESLRDGTDARRTMQEFIERQGREQT